MSSSSTHPQHLHAHPEGTSQGPRTRPRLPRERRGWLVLAGIGLIAVALGGNAALIAAVDARAPMVVLKHDVSWGQPVTDNDVSIVDASSDLQSIGINKQQWSHLRGSVAASPLHGGRLLAPGDVTTQTIPGPGQQVVGLQLPAGRYPQGLSTNSPVLVVPTNAGTAGSDPSTSPPSTSSGGFPARVVRAAGPDQDGGVHLDVLIDQSQLPQATSAATTGALAVALGPTP